jgi:hypothetical protein
MQVMNSSVTYFEVAKFEEGNKKAPTLKVVFTQIPVFGKVGV